MAGLAAVILVAGLVEIEAAIVAPAQEIAVSGQDQVATEMPGLTGLSEGLSPVDRILGVEGKRLLDSSFLLEPALLSAPDAGNAPLETAPGTMDEPGILTDSQSAANAVSTPPPGGEANEDRLSIVNAKHSVLVSLGLLAVAAVAVAWWGWAWRAAKPAG